ncbi:MAG: hypothetical protein LUE29_05035 [Lachnospiraceae bacterium]|nr:hypothetical protein [Lachnospiraceae bacterium]
MKRHRTIFLLTGLIAALNFFRCLNQGWNAADWYVDLLALVGLGNPEMRTVPLVMMAGDMVPIFCFELIFGISLYQHYCTCSVYYFSRQNNRSKWYLMESAKLFGYTAEYMALYVFLSALTAVVAAGGMFADDISAGGVIDSNVLAGNITANSIWPGDISTGSILAGYISTGGISAGDILADSISPGSVPVGDIPGDSMLMGTIILCLMITALYTLYAFCFTLLINILCIAVGSQFSYVAVIGAQLALVLANVVPEVTELEGALRLKLLLNPTASLVLSWHTPVMGEYWEQTVAADFSVWYSFLYLAAIAGIVLFAGRLAVKRTDILGGSRAVGE